MSANRGSSWITVTRVLGSMAPFVCGLATIWLLQSLGSMLALGLGLLALIGVGSALLLRSWWALAVIPATYLVGWIAGGVLHASLPGNAWEPGTEVLMLGMFALFMLLPLLVGAAIGTLISQWLWRPAHVAHDPKQGAHDPAKARPVGS
jgi:hypothetical protein